MWGLLFIISIIYSVYYAKKLSETTKHPKADITSDEFLHVILPEIFSPVIAGAIFYYSWRKKMPKKASSANKYSWIIFGAMILIAIISSMY